MRGSGVALAGVALLGLTACETTPVCRRGELRYEGRPPRELFSFDSSCRTDCFSLPADLSCKAECPEVDLLAGTGLLLADRTLWLADTESLGSGRALVFSFGYVDEALGDAPTDWGLSAAGVRTYLADQVESTARFTMQTSTVAFTREDDLLVVTELLGGPWIVEPGRLEILAADVGRLAGRFFLGYETATNQPQGEVHGCFDLSLSEEREAGGMRYQVLGP